MTASEPLTLIELLPDLPEEWNPHDSSQPSIGWELFAFVEQFIQSEQDRFPRVPFTKDHWCRFTPILIRCMDLAKQHNPNGLRGLCIQVIRLFASSHSSHTARAERRIYELREDAGSNATEQERRAILEKWLEVCPDWNRENDPLTKNIWDQVRTSFDTRDEE